MNPFTEFKFRFSGNYQKKVLKDLVWFNGLRLGLWFKIQIIRGDETHLKYVSSDVFQNNTKVILIWKPTLEMKTGGKEAGEMLFILRLSWPINLRGKSIGKVGSGPLGSFLVASEIHRISSQCIGSDWFEGPIFRMCNFQESFCFSLLFWIIFRIFHNYIPKWH